MTVKKQGKIRFYEKSHKYKIGKTELTSVTTFLGQFFEPFDAKKIAKFKAMISKRQGRPEENATYWKKTWKQVALDGTAIHAELEDYMFGNKKDNFTLKAFGGVRWLEGYMRIVGEPVESPEYIIYNEELGLAGQIDLLVHRNMPESAARCVDLIDYKTNKKITTEGYRGKKSKEPISELDDCSYTKYTLQLSLYAYMLELQGETIGDLKLLHLTEDGAVEMPIKYEKELIRRLIEHGKETN